MGSGDRPLSNHINDYICKTKPDAANVTNKCVSKTHIRQQLQVYATPRLLFKSNISVAEFTVYASI